MSYAREYNLKYTKSHPEYVNAIRRKSYASSQIKVYEERLQDATDLQRQKYLLKILGYKNNLDIIEQELVEIRKKYNMRQIKSSPENSNEEI